jgi:hypothetical protein
VAGSDRAGETLIERLAARRPELEQTVLARVNSVGDPSPAADPEYALGLKAAVNAAVSYGLSAIEGGGSRAEPVPHELLAQARRAARSGVGLDTVLRRYVAGHALLGDYFLQAAEGDERLQGAPLQRLLRAEAVLFDRLVVAVTEEHGRELRKRRCSAKQRRAECVERLLAGEFADTSALAYDLEAWHLGVVAVGPGGPQTVKDLAGALDRRLLLVQPGGPLTWAWLGGGNRIEAGHLTRLAKQPLSTEVALSIGEPAQGLSGWRFTHRQAAAALPIAIRRPGSPARYADFALLAALLQDDVLANSLQDLYLAPLVEGRDGGEALRWTARAYFAAGRNVSAAAAALGVSRPTIKSRLQTIEERIGRPLDTCAAEVETALRLQELLPAALPPQPAT